MNLNARILILTTCLIAIAAPAPLHAAKGAKKADKADRAARPGMFLKKYDTDKNGAIDGTEVEALRKAFDNDPLRKLDANKDGMLGDEEIATIKVRHGKGKGAARKSKKNA